MERYFWTAGLDVLERMLLKMMLLKSMAKITKEHIKMRIKQSWAPNLPRDREADVQEWVQRASADLGSIDHLLELTGDVEDIPAEKKLILEWKEALATMQAEIAKKYAPEPAPFGGSSSPKKPAAKKEPAKKEPSK
jgi:type VI protein secretion system component VasK